MGPVARCSRTTSAPAENEQSQIGRHVPSPERAPMCVEDNDWASGSADRRRNKAGAENRSERSQEFKL